MAKRPGKSKPVKTAPAPVGRPTLYTPGLGDEICRRIADGESLRAVCRDENMPAESAVRAWSIDPEHPISAQYEKARESQYARWAEELLEIADDGTNDYVERQRQDGSSVEAVDAEHIQRSRLRVDTRKWLLSKLLPKRFGDKVEIGGPGGGPIEHSVVVAFVKSDA